jgi:hypothetical protein
VTTYAEKRELQIYTERVPLADIESAWQREHPGRRLVVVS